MRDGPSSGALAKRASWEPRISSWLGGQVLADNVPISSGRITWTADQKVQSKLRLTVPFLSVENGRTRRWRPGKDPRHPLARFGQVLDVSLLVNGFLIRLGRFMITDWDDRGDGVTVDAEGMLKAVADDRLTKPTGPRDDGTLRSEFARLTPDYMTVAFDDSLADRACPKAMEWPEDRIGALYEITDAWPARLREDSWGALRVLPPLPPDPVPVVSLTDGENGTVVGAPTADTREGSYNVFVARSSADGVEAQAQVAVDAGPMAAAGEYRPVPMFFSSPLLDNEEQCLAAAETRRANSVRASRLRKVSLAPDPRLELDDPVELWLAKGTDDEDHEWGYVVGAELPLTVRDGDMQVDIATF